MHFCLEMRTLGITVLFFLQGYFYNDDTFNFNYAQAKAALGNYKEAEEVPYFSIHLYNSFLEALINFDTLLTVVLDSF